MDMWTVGKGRALTEHTRCGLSVSPIFLMATSLFHLHTLLPKGSHEILTTS